MTAVQKRQALFKSQFLALACGHHSVHLEQVLQRHFFHCLVLQHQRVRVSGGCHNVINDDSVSHLAQTGDTRRGFIDDRSPKGRRQCCRHIQLIPLTKLVITPVINGISRVNPLITGVISHLLSGMSHQVVSTSLN